jgi:hypothetical protein
MRGTRRPLLRGKLRSEGGIKLTGELGVSFSGLSFVASQGVSQKRFGDQETILLVSASTTRASGGLVLTDTTG